ncbi:cytochrome P450 3A12 [Mollisia scopiformis]|uniref:Cytochrome P450 3A12 n=1 Tax=Mollisia scopiformis TaxID=149040 RepID=A0A194XNS6_MOLSC|nr:cytochrome P450 3A12 [Mollisia scopiformis]KUJ21764.1 cytochrome P450 3A12 [Mollisia scopiformis]
MFSSSVLLLGVVSISFLAIYKLIIYPAFLSPLAKVPNAHWSSPIAPIWILWTRYNDLENRVLHAAHLKHGTVVRLAPNELSINDLAGLRTVYAGGFEKGEWYSIFDNYGVPCMFSSWHSRTHSARKRMISNIYSKSNIHNSPALAAQAQAILYDRLLPKLTSASGPQSHPNGVDVHDIWNATTMDFITAYIFGLKNASNFLAEEVYRKHWFGLYHARKVYTFFPQELPHLTVFFKKLHLHLVPTWVNDANRELEVWTQERCHSTSAYIKNGLAAKDNDPANVPVVFQAMLAGIEKEERMKGAESVLKNETLQYPELSIASEMIDHIAAGHETSGITLTYLSWELSKNIPLQDALRAELLSLSPNMSLSGSGSSKSIPSSKDLNILPLLHAILMETLRLHAAIPGNQPRMTPYPSCTLGPYTDIPGGVRIGSHAHVLHRNSEVYLDPDKFDHVRWLDDQNGYTEEQRRERDRWFWAFSSGGRMCVGSNFAMHEIKLTVAAVYANFRTHIVDDEGIEQTDGYTCGPTSNKLFLRFEKVVD